MIEIKKFYDDKDKYKDQEITINGWVRTIRSTTNVGFIELNDGSSMNNIQIVFSNDMDNFDEVSKYPIASALEIEGKFVLTNNTKQPFEIQAKKIKLLKESSKDYPLQKKRHTFEYLRTIPHLRGRTNTFMAVFRLRSVLSHAIHRFFESRGFVYIHTPIITTADAEGAGEVFRVTTLNPLKENKSYNDDFFQKETFLTVSGQLNIEPFALAYGKVYNFGPTFRSENSNTVRHASEFWMIEPEISFCDLDCLTVVIEDMMKYVIEYAFENAKEELEFFDQRIEKGLIDKLKKVLKSDFSKITYTDAVKILEKNNDKFEYKATVGGDIQTEHEKYLAHYFDGPVFITDYPKDIKAFYMKQNDDNFTVRATDLIVPGLGEIVGGSQREDDYDKLLNEMKRRGLNIEDYQWYLDLRKYGSVTQSGFGLGFERLIQYMSGMSNIRDVISYPRTPKHADM